MGRIAETIRCMVRLTDSAILEVAIRWSSAFSRLTDALNAETQRQTIEQPKRASGRSFASVVTQKRPSLNHAGTLSGASSQARRTLPAYAIRSGSTPPLNQGDPPCSFPPWPRMTAGLDLFWLFELRVF